MDKLFDSYQDIIPDFKRFKEILSRPIPTHLRINSIKSDTQETLNSLRDKSLGLGFNDKQYQNLVYCRDLNSPGNLIEYFLGAVHPQAFTSCLAAIALCPKKDSYVLDMCASPGGKTAHMADLMKNSGTIVANELYSNRQVPLGNTLARLGVANTVVTGYQAQEFPLKHSFDFILADVPCSGEGRFRLSDETKGLRKLRKQYAIQDLQKKIIVRGFDLLKEHGVMLYSTCTYNPDENESIIDFLLKSRDAEVLPLSLGPYEDMGLLGWNGRHYDKRIGNTRRFYPHRIDSVGFFMAKIGRR